MVRNVTAKGRFFKAGVAIDHGDVDADTPHRTLQHV